MKLKITVHGVAYEVEVEVLDPGEGFPGIDIDAEGQTSKRCSRFDSSPPSPQKSAAPKAVAGTNGGSVSSPIAGTIVEIKCKAGDSVSKDQILLVIEAMKMKTSIAAPTTGKVKAVPVAVGDSVRENQTLVELE